MGVIAHYLHGVLYRYVIGNRGRYFLSRGRLEVIGLLHGPRLLHIFAKLGWLSEEL